MRGGWLGMGALGVLVGACSLDSSGTGPNPLRVPGPDPSTCNPTRGPTDETCGVHVSVSKGDDASGDGTATSPYRTLAKALAMAAQEGKPVLACAEVFEEAVAIEAPVALYGGLACDEGWTYVGATQKTLVKTGADEVPLTIGGDAAGSLIFGLDVEAADAQAPGGSSIAVIVDSAKIDFTDCDFVAGKAMDGASGVSLAADPALDGIVGTSGEPVCGGDGVAPVGPTMSCPNGGESRGGDGGAGTLQGDPGQAGGDGAPAYASQPGGGLGGAGQGAGDCAPGSNGAKGDDGVEGSGATGAGTLSIHGYAGPAGVSGTSGMPGQGGGGGGGTKGAIWTCQAGELPAARLGASGGAGGTGGCGGTGGEGGKAGGSSVALVSLNAVITLSNVSLRAGLAGNGGAGAGGQLGGNKGAHGPPGHGAGPIMNACEGGLGGRGGVGGPGGGGLGGHSLGIAFAGAAPTGGTFAVDPQGFGKGGLGGAGLTPDVNGGTGDDGLSADVREIPATE